MTTPNGLDFDPLSLERHASEGWHPRLSLESASFLKKRSKKLLLLRAPAPSGPAPTVSKSFLVTFFQKSNFFL
jgi:hypothetical protein